MALNQIKLVTIVVEVGVEKRVIRDLKALGIHGFTVSSAHGEGPRNRRAGELEGGNAKIEILVGELLIEPIAAMLKEKYLENYACVFWVSDVSVFRTDYF